MAQASSARMGTDTPGGGSVPTIEHLLIDIVGTTNVDTGADDSEGPDGGTGQRLVVGVVLADVRPGVDIGGTDDVDEKVLDGRHRPAARGVRAHACR